MQLFTLGISERICNDYQKYSRYLPGQAKHLHEQPRYLASRAVVKVELDAKGKQRSEAARGTTGNVPMDQQTVPGSPCRTLDPYLTALTITAPLNKCSRLRSNCPMPMRNRKTFPVITVYLREIQTHFARTDRYMIGTHAFDIISSNSII